MVQTMGPYPLFWYIYSPHDRRGNRKSFEQGFNVILYSDGALVRSRYTDKIRRVERQWFRLPVEVADELLMILQNEAWWLRGLPENIRAPHGKPAYRCMCAYVGHPLFTCDELKRMTQLEDVNRNGVYARRLHVMFEFVTELLFHYGVLLQLESFDWNHDMLSPIPESQIDDHARSLVEQDEYEMMQVRNEAWM